MLSRDTKIDDYFYHFVNTLQLDLFDVVDDILKADKARREWQLTLKDGELQEAWDSLLDGTVRAVSGIMTLLNDTGEITPLRWEALRREVDRQYMKRQEAIEVFRNRI